jgi:hypothetical protein
MKKRIKAIYEWFLKLLLSTPFKWLYLTLSHGFFHLVLLIVIGGLALYFYKNNQDKLKDTVTHTIWVKTEALAREADEFGYRTNYDMKHFHLELTLNSDSIEKRTEGKYRDAISMRFMPPSMKKDTTILPACIDTVRVMLLRQPYSSDVMVESSVNDSLPGNENIPQAEIVKDSAGVCKVNTVLANCAKIPVVRQYTKGANLTIYSNDFSVGKSPYYYYNIRFDNPDPQYLDSSLYVSFQYEFAINLDDSWTYNDEFGRYSTKQIVIHEIEPKPDFIKGNYIGYYSKESIEAIRQNDGVKLFAEDLAVSNKNKQEEFLNSVLIGTCLAFMLDIIVQLVLKLRRLHQTRKKEKK